MKLSDKQKASLEKVRNHNLAQYKGDKFGTMKKEEVTEVYEETMEHFASEIYETRDGKKVDKWDRKVPAYNISFAQAISHTYGIVAPDKDEEGMHLSKKGKEMFVIKKFLKDNQCFMSTDTLSSTAKRFGNSNLTAYAVQELMVNYSEFGGANNTTNVPADFRFIIPELILAAIRLDYEASVNYKKWVSSSLNISQREIKMPQIRRGNTNIRKIEESESIPFGTVRFGQKTAKVFKVGTGFKITDELVETSSIDMMFEFIGQVGNDMAIATDVEAARVLLNGEQEDGSESAPVIGVDTVGQYKWIDLRRVISRMKWLKRDISRVITSETDGINLSLLPEFNGFNGDTTLAKWNTMLGMVPQLENDVFVMPNNQILFVSPQNAMVELNYRGMKTERRRNPQNQEDELFVSNHVGFAIKRRDGRLIVDKSLAYGSPDNATFPPYMDVAGRISEGFKTIDA